MRAAVLVLALFGCRAPTSPTPHAARVPDSRTGFVEGAVLDSKTQTGVAGVRVDFDGD